MNAAACRGHQETVFRQMSVTHQQPDFQGFALFFWHRQVTRVQALPIVMETEAGLDAGDVSSHSEVDGWGTKKQTLQYKHHLERAHSVNLFFMYKDFSNIRFMQKCGFYI